MRKFFCLPRLSSAWFAIDAEVACAELKDHTPLRECDTRAYIFSIDHTTNQVIAVVWIDD